MGRLIVGALWLNLWLGVFAFPAPALDVPPLRGRVNDLAGMLPPERARSLEARLAKFETETGHQIVVLTIPSLEGEDLEGYSIRVAESWKIGHKGLDNGAILLVARDDRKLRIEVGYGLEGILPDAIASRIIREVIIPRFRAGDFAGGIEAGAESMMKVARGEKVPLPARTPREQSETAADRLMALLMASLFALALGVSQTSLSRGIIGGAAAGAISALLSGAGARPLFWASILFLGALLGGLGTVFADRGPNRRWSGRR
ncbi:MAG TPA: YgcG family protein, partial [Candidatus Binatia bacterium]|nr:YgcG family protein [Candidatus Binatia bacterium]